MGVSKIETVEEQVAGASFRVKSSEYFNASRLIDTEAELEKLIMN
jgi:hypothetical protein